MGLNKGAMAATPRGRAAGAGGASRCAAPLADYPHQFSVRDAHGAVLVPIALVPATSMVTDSRTKLHHPALRSWSIQAQILEGWINWYLRQETRHGQPIVWSP